MIMEVIMPVVLTVAPGSGSGNFCFQKVEAKMSQEMGKSADIDIDFYSPGDLTQKVIGPLRRNRLSKADKNEIEAFLKLRENQFYHLTSRLGAGIETYLLVVNADTCEIKKRYVLIDGVS